LIIDTIAAERLFGPASAVGQQITLPGTPTATVIGVAANVRLVGPEGAIQPQVYRPLRSDMGARVLIVRTAVAPEQITPAIEAAIASVMPRKSAPLTVISAEEEFQFLTADRRFNATLMSSLGLLALLIAATGVYATTAAMVAQRTKEIGIRMALGASATRVVRSVTWTTARLLLTGALLGLVGAWTTSGLLSSVVFEIQPTDVIVYVVPAVLIAAGGVLAALVPARRAARIDPLIALRTE
jgi:ABC-type antimicrobial peptide transport system permease subunit